MRAVTLRSKLPRDPLRGLTRRKRICNDLREELSPTRNKRQFRHAYRRLRWFGKRMARERIERARFARALTRMHVRVHQ